MTKIGTAFFCAQISTSIIFFEIPTAQVMFVFAFPFFLKSIVLFFYQRRDSLFQSEFPAIASMIILHMKDGNSFRKSVELSTEHASQEHQFILKQLLDFVVFSQQKVQEDRQNNKLFTHFLLNKLIKIDQESHRSIEKMETLKNNIQTLNEFRRRSGKIRAQLYAQLFVIGGMYLAVSIAVIFLFGWKKNIFSFASSVLLFGTSCVLSYKLGRKIKWSV